MKKKIKRAFTLMELMVVIAIIGMIMGVIGYNMRGSLDSGKAFKTQQAIRKLYDIINLEIAKGNIPAAGNAGIEAALQRSGLVSNPSQLMKDGWNQPITVHRDDPNNFHFTSAQYELYCTNNHKQFDYPWQ